MVHSLSDRRMTWVVYSLVIAITATIFFSDVRHLLVGVDDEGTLRNHPKISQDFFYLFSPEKERASGRVVDEFVLWLGYLLWGENLALFHLLVAAIHALASFSLAICCRRIGAGMASSLGTGILFLTNIAHVGTVHWISALEYPLALLACAWTLYFYVCFIKTQKKFFLCFFYTLFIISILTHFITILLWPFCWYYARIRSINYPTIARYLLPIFPALIGTLFGAFAMMGEDNTTQSALLFHQHALKSSGSFISAILDGIQLFLWYLGRLLFMAHWLPSNPGVQHPLEMGIGIATLAVLIYLAWRGDNSVRWWSIWTLTFVISFVPAALVHVGISYHIYLASAGFSFLLSWGILQISTHLAHYQRYTITIALFVLLICSYRAENRLANLSLYVTGHYYITQNKAHIGLSILREAIERDDGLISIEEARVYQLMGSLQTGEDYEEVLLDALDAHTENFVILITHNISELVKSNESIKLNPEILNVLHEQFPIEKEPFLHIVNKMSQNMGNWHYKKGDIESAVRSFQLSLRANPYDKKSAENLVKILIEDHRYKEAIDSANKMMLSHVDNPLFLIVAAMGYVDTGQLDKAVKNIERAVQLDSSLNGFGASLFFKLGTSYDIIGRTEDAVFAYKKTIALGADNIAPYYRLGEIFFLANRLDYAKEIYQQSLHISPENSIIYYNIGNIALVEKDTVSAIEAFEHSIRINDSSLKTHLVLGHLYFKKGMLEKSNVSYQRVLALESNNSSALNGIGCLLFYKGDYNEAIAFFKKSNQFQPNAVAQFNLGLSYVALRDSLLATHIYQRAIKTFGAKEAYQTGAVDMLKSMLNKPKSAHIARQLLKEISMQSD